MHHIVICGLWPVQLYNIFQHCLINGTIFRGKKVTEHNMFLCLQLLSETVLVLRTVQSAVTINVNTSPFIGLVPLICVRFCETFKNYKRFSVVPILVL